MRRSPPDLPGPWVGFYASKRLGCRTCASSSKPEHTYDQKDGSDGGDICKPVESARLTAKLGERLQHLYRPAECRAPKKDNDQGLARIGECCKAREHKAGQDVLDLVVWLIG